MNDVLIQTAINCTLVSALLNVQLYAPSCTVDRKVLNCTFLTAHATASCSSQHVCDCHAGYPIGCQIRQLGEVLLSDNIQSQLSAYGLKPLSSLHLPPATVSASLISAFRLSPNFSLLHSHKKHGCLLLAS